MFPTPTGGYSGGSGAQAGPNESGSIGGSGFSTGYFGRGMDLEKLALPLTAVAIVALLWVLNKKRR